MLRTFIHELRPAATLLAAFTIICGALYPGAVTGIARMAFPHRAGGSLVERDGKVVGSGLVAQPFAAPGHFWPRPSACGYDAAASSGSNLAMSNPALAEAAKTRAAELRIGEGSGSVPITVDLVLASGSGLDPHVSVEAAMWQVPRVARERHMEAEAVRALVRQNVEGRTFGLLGEERVNVLRLNLALDARR